MMNGGIKINRFKKKQTSNFLLFKVGFFYKPKQAL